MLEEEKMEKGNNLLFYILFCFFALNASPKPVAYWEPFMRGNRQSASKLEGPLFRPLPSWMAFCRLERDLFRPVRVPVSTYEMALSVSGTFYLLARTLSGRQRAIQFVKRPFGKPSLST